MPCQVNSRPSRTSPDRRVSPRMLQQLPALRLAQVSGEVSAPAGSTLCSRAAGDAQRAAAADAPTLGVASAPTTDASTDRRSRSPPGAVNPTPDAAPGRVARRGRGCLSIFRQPRRGFRVRRGAVAEHRRRARRSRARAWVSSGSAALVVGTDSCRAAKADRNIAHLSCRLPPGACGPWIDAPDGFVAGRGPSRRRGGWRREPGALADGDQQHGAVLTPTPGSDVRTWQEAGPPAVR